jgi:hypothetical protein
MLKTYMGALLIEDGSALSGTAIEKFDDLVQELTGNRDNPWKGLGYKKSAGPFRRRRCPNSKLQLFQRTCSSHNRRSSIFCKTRLALVFSRGLVRGFFVEIRIMVGAEGFVTIEPAHDVVEGEFIAVVPVGLVRVVNI